MVRRIVGKLGGITDREHATTGADIAGSVLVAVGVGAYSWPAGLIVAGVAVLAGSWAAQRAAVVGVEE